MSRYIKVEDAIEAAISGCASWDGGYFPSMDEPIKEEFEAVNDKCIDLVRCRECIHRPKMPDNYVDGFDLEFPDHKCPCRCEDGFYSWYPAADWFCADGERRSDEQ